MGIFMGNDLGPLLAMSKDVRYFIYILMLNKLGFSIIYFQNSALAIDWHCLLEFKKIKS